MKSLDELRAIKEQMKTKIGIRNDDKAKVRVVVGMATCGIAAGARPVLAVSYTHLDVYKRQDQHAPRPRN